MSNFSRVNFESMLEVSVNRRLTAALEEGNGKTPSWLQWEEEQTLNGIKERRKQLHTEMASIQRWVHISRKYTCGLTKIHEGSEKRCLSWEIQNSKAEDLRRKREDGLGAAQWPQSIKQNSWVYQGLGCTWRGWHEATLHCTHTSQTTGAPNRRPATKAAANTNTWSSYQGRETLINQKAEAVKIHFFKRLKSEKILQMGWQPESGRKRQKQGGTLANICGTSLEAGQVAVDGRTNVTPIHNSSSRKDQGH